MNRGNAELVEDGVTGYLLPPEDSAAFAERILSLSRDPALALRLGEAGFRKAQAYTVSQVSKELGKILLG